MEKGIAAAAAEGRKWEGRNPTATQKRARARDLRAELRNWWGLGIGERGNHSEEEEEEGVGGGSGRGWFRGLCEDLMVKW